MTRIHQVNMIQRPAARRERGVVMVIALLALMLIASLVFYVFNIGRNVQSRVVTQHAADSAVMGGAGWVARAMNTTAMNNVEMARLVAQINVLDATDQALHPAYHIANTHYYALKDLSPSPGGNLSQREAVFLRHEMKPYIEDYHHDLEQLTPVKQLLEAPKRPREYRVPSGSFDIRNDTFYNPPKSQDQGEFWKAMQALDTYSQTIMRTLPQLSQRAAAHGGRVNMHRGDPDRQGSAQGDRAKSRAGQAMLTPVMPRIPTRRGEFDDLQRPVEQGLLDHRADDERVRRGPYDTVFGWRKAVIHQTTIDPGHRVKDGPPSEGSGPGGPGGVVPPDLPPSSHWDPKPQKKKKAVAYRVYGPQYWLLHKVGKKFKLRRSPLKKLRNKFAAWKLQYLWHHRGLTQYRFPVFLIDWNRATAAADGKGRGGRGASGGSGGSGGREIHRTRFFVTRVESQIAPDRPAFLTPGTYKRLEDDSEILTLKGDWKKPTSACAPLRGNFGNDPRQWRALLSRMRHECGSYDRLSGSAKGYWDSVRFENLQNSNWRKVRFSSKINRDGKTRWQVTYYFCIGVDVGEKLPVRNPHNFADRSDLPAPTELDYDTLDWDDQQARRRYLTFLGIAQQPNTPTFWAHAFDDAKGYPKHLALAQAHVFNNHSWDLWTQMWHAGLQPIDHYDHWVDRLSDASVTADQIPGMSNQALDQLTEHMRNIASPAKFMLRH